MEQTLTDAQTNGWGHLLESSGFMPHGHCFLWREDILLLHMVSDLVIAFSYFAIPFAIIYLIQKKKGLRFNWIAVLFASFIVACGMTHLFNVYNLWHTDYAAEGLMKAITAGISFATTICLYKMIPGILSYPSREELGDRIKQRTKSLEETIRQLEDEINLRKKVEAELKSAKEAAETATHSKSLFLANMSHEIRTPLGIMLSLSEQIAKASNLTSRQQDLLNIIRRNGNLLSRVINDILDFSKIESGKIEFDVNQIEVKDLIRDINDTFKFRADEKGLNFKITLADNVPEFLYSDDLRVKQILLNLLTNAFKHTDKGSITMTITSSQDQKNMIFDIEDTGAGIPVDYQERIFEPFEQAVLNKGGTGLGLALAKLFSEILHGQLTLVKSVLHQGSHFRLSLANDSASSDKVPLPLASLANPLNPPNLAEKSILVVDDNEDNLLVMELLLKDTQVKMTFANSGNEALKQIENQEFDLILMDLQMPEMDGFATLAKMREKKYSMDVWAVSAYAMKDDVRKSREAGFSLHVSKPIQTSDLYRRLRNLFPA